MAVKLTIELNDQGQIMFTGPLHDKVICYGLLEACKDAVREQVAKKPLIAAPHPLVNYRANGG